MRKRIISLIMTGFMSASLLAVCGNAASTSAPSADADQSQSAPASEKT